VEDDSLKRVGGDGSCKLFNIPAVLAIAVRNHPSQIRGRWCNHFSRFGKRQFSFISTYLYFHPKRKLGALQKRFPGKIIEITLFLYYTDSIFIFKKENALTNRKMVAEIC
jgi:hypothetical protein